MKLLNLSAGKVAKISDEDWGKVNKYKWSAINPQRFTWYGIRTCHIGEPGRERGEKVYLHRFVVDAPAHSRVKIVNKDPLDCQRHNLSVAPLSDAAIGRLQAKRWIRPVLEGISSMTSEEIGMNQYRGLYRDLRHIEKNSGEGGYLVKSYKDGTGFFGVYRTLARAMSMRDAQERDRAAMGMPPIIYMPEPAPEPLAVGEVAPIVKPVIESIAWDDKYLAELSKKSGVVIDGLEDLL